MRFRYSAIDGAGRKQSGIIESDRAREAQRLLRQQGLNVLAINTAETKAPLTSFKKKTASREDLARALESLSLLLEAGLPLAGAVGSVATEGGFPGIEEAFGEVEKRLRGGESFSVALKGGLPNFPDYVYRLIEAGEESGRLAQALRDGNAQMRYDEDIRREVRNALTYPAVLISAGFTAILFIFVVVVPRFASMIERAGSEVPWLSMVVINTGLFFNANWPWLVGGLAVLGGSLAWALGRPRVKIRVMEVVYELPLVGGWLTEAESARWSGTLASMLENGVPALQAMAIARASVVAPGMRARLEQAERLVRGGSRLGDALAKQDVLTDTAVSLIRIGEEAGHLPEMLRSVWRLYDRSGRERMKRFLLLLEPAAIIIIGGMVGIIVTAIMLAITSINQIAI